MWLQYFAQPLCIVKMEMGFSVLAPASFPMSAEGGRDVLGAGSQHSKMSQHRTPLENKGEGIDWTVFTLTLIHLLHVQVLLPPTALLEPCRLSQEMPMAWKGTLNGLDDCLS